MIWAIDEIKMTNRCKGEADEITSWWNDQLMKWLADQMTN